MMGRRALLLFTALCVVPAAQAGLFDNREQEAAKLFDQGEFEQAADRFSDDYRRGVAQYRAGEYADAADSFTRVERESVKTQASTPSFHSSAR